MKKYKLKDLVNNGSTARRKVDSDVLIGDSSHGYGQGDILDANATSEMIKQKISDLHVDDINQAVIDEVNSLRNVDEEYDNRISALEEKQGQMSAEINEAGDHLILNF